MKINFSLIKKILIIAPFRFGDTLLNSAYLPSLREKFPLAKIDFLTRIPCQVMLEGNPYIDEIILLRKKRWLANIWQRIKIFRRVRKAKYDLVVDQTRGTTGGQIALFSGAKYRLGYATSRYRKVFNLLGYQGKQRYSAAMRFDLLKPLGIKEKRFNFFFKIKDKDRDYINNWLVDKDLVDKRFIVLSPGSPVKRKMWPPKKYAKLCDLLSSKTDYVPLLLWGPSELETIKKIQRVIKEKVVLAPPTNFSQAGALLEKAEMLICNDGGINHFSQAVGCPSLAIFMDCTEVKNWSLQGTFPEHWHITARNNRDLTVEKVFEKLKKCLN